MVQVTFADLLVLDNEILVTEYRFDCECYQKPQV